jgi:hypothetical protein
MALVLVGLAARLLRYGLRFPIWGDEAMVALALRDHGFRGLAGFLASAPSGTQVAPTPFLWFELVMYRLFGGSELSLRLWAIVTGCAGLWLFVLLARTLCGRLAAVFAVGMLAVGNFPIRYAAEVKPYASDLLLSAALLLLAALFLRRPRQLAWLALLALIVPVALLCSFPAVFVAGGVSAGLFGVVWREGGAKRWALYLLFNAVLIGAFLASYLLVTQGQYAAAQRAMLPYWHENFPPSAPWELAKWLVLTHTGMMFALPFGGANGASAATTLLVLLGGRRLWQQRRWPWLVMLLVPFLLSLIAAALHRYPYGASSRLCQYLAPSIGLLGGLGMARLVSWVRLVGVPWLKRSLAPAWIVLLLVFGVGMMIHDLYRPGQTVADIVDRRVIQGVFRRAHIPDRVIVLNDWGKLDANKQWYLLQETDEPASGGFAVLTRPWGLVASNANPVKAGSGDPGGLWFMEYCFRKAPRGPSEIGQLFVALSSQYELAGMAEVSRLPSDSSHEPDSYWQVFHFVPRRAER